MGPSFPWASLNLKQRQLPIQRLTLTFFMEATMEDLDLDIIMEASTVATLTTATTARDLLTLSLLLPLLLMPRLIPGMDTTVDTTTVATHTMAMVTAMATTGANKKGTSNAGLTGMKCQQFLTTTCPMFS